jgi:hypothetical protein
MGTSSTKNCQGFSKELPGCSGANLIKKNKETCKNVLILFF